MCPEGFTGETCSTPELSTTAPRQQSEESSGMPPAAIAAIVAGLLVALCAVVVVVVVCILLRKRSSKRKCSYGLSHTHDVLKFTYKPIVTKHLLIFWVNKPVHHSYFS